MEGQLLSVEFRNKSWFDGDHAAKTVAFERELGVVHTIVDSPQGFANCVPCVWEATHPELALMRPRDEPGLTLGKPGPSAPAATPSTETADKEAAGKLAAQGWLVLLDRRDWGRAWETSSAVFRTTVPLGTWMDGIPKLRDTFG